MPTQQPSPGPRGALDGCTLCPPGVRPRSVGPGRSGWGPGCPVLGLQLLLKSGDLRTLLLYHSPRPGAGSPGSVCAPPSGPRRAQTTHRWVADQGQGQALSPSLRQSRPRRQVATTRRIGKGPAGPSGAAPGPEDMPVSPLRVLFSTPSGAPSRPPARAARRSPRSAVVCVYRLPPPSSSGSV